MSKNGMQIAAVVVTYNRKELLLECIDALLAQTYSLWKIIVIDNASTDGTQQTLREKGYLDHPVFSYHLMEKNLGGAGGFYEGMKYAREYRADWVWIMDDDTIPGHDALRAMAEKTAKYPGASFFASCVEGPAHEPMNVPTIDSRPTANGYSDWYMAMNDRLLKIKTATFVSLLINGKAIEKCGLPCRDFFLWGDDSEYTTRLTRHFGPAYMAGDSWVCHKRANASSLNIHRENNPNRIKNYHYLSRNGLIFSAKYDAKAVFIRKFLSFQYNSVKALVSGRHGLMKFCQVQKGIFEFFFNYRRFSRIIDGELSGTRQS